MDTLAAVAIGILSLIFLGSLLALVFICRQRYCQKSPDRKPILKYSRGDGSGGGGLALDAEEMEEILQLSPEIQALLSESEWVHDASGLVEHCLCILRSCHGLVGRLAGLPSSLPSPTKSAAEELAAATRLVLPRLNDLVRCLGTVAVEKRREEAAELLPRAPLLEARAAALVMAVSALGLAFRAAFPKAKAEAAEIRRELTAAHAHLAALRSLAQAAEADASERLHILNLSSSSSFSPATATAAESRPNRTGTGTPSDAKDSAGPSSAEPL